MAKAAKQSKGFKTAGKKRAPKHKNTISVMYGDEPMFLETPTMMQLSKALSWYSKSSKTQDLREEVFKWMGLSSYTSAEIKAAKERKAIIVMTDCALARMLNRGCVLPIKSVLHLSDRVNKLLQHRVVEEVDYDDDGKEVSGTDEGKRLSPRERAERRAERVNAQLIEHIDATIDSIAKRGDATFASAFELFDKTQPNPISIAFIQKWVQQQMGWVNDAYKNPEDYRFTRNELKVFMNIYKDIYDEADKRLHTKRERKPRKQKARNVDKAVAKVRYAAESKVAKCKSVNPAGIIGATEVWVYNETFNKLGVYYAEAGKTLDIARSSIVNFDEARSEEKRIGKKPAEVVGQVLTAMRQGLKKILGGINATPNALSGRLTPNVVIVRCVK